MEPLAPNVTIIIDINVFFHPKTSKKEILTEKNDEIDSVFEVSNNRE